MKPVIIIAIAVGVAISASVIWFVLDSDSDVMKTACDIHKDQVFEMGKRFEEIRELQKEIPLGTDDYFRLDQEFQVLTDEAL
ncbi:MAG: hypothetical protein QQN55_07870, partial [Nitrosopumilus sp.]